MADTDILIKDLPLTETVNDSDDLVTEDSSPTTHRIKASVVKNYINAEQNEELEGFRVDLDNTNSNIGSLSSKVDEATITVSNMQSTVSSLSNDKADNSSLTDGSVTKVGTSTVGSETKPIYLSSGTPTASSSTVGSGAKPVYLNSGTITACTMSSVLTSQSFTDDNISISSGAYSSGTMSCSRSGYTAIGVIGFSISNGSSSGSGSSMCFPTICRLSNSTTIQYQIYNSRSSTSLIAITVYVLYVAS